MTTFIEVGSGAGFLHLPDHLIDPRPIDVDRFTDHRVLFCIGEEVAEYDDGGVMDTLAAVRRLRARADAIEAHALTRLDTLRDGSRYVPDEAALELRMSRHATADRVATARTLTADMPQLLAAMESGHIERHPATKIANTVTHLNARQRREVDQQLADKLATGKLCWLDPSRLVRAARRLVTKVDPNGQTDRARRARAERKVELIPGEDSMSTLAAELPAELAASAYSRIDGMPGACATTATNAPSISSAPTSTPTCFSATTRARSHPPQRPRCFYTCPPPPRSPSATTEPSCPATGRCPGRSPARS